MRRVIIYTDGASKGNPGPAGAGVLITDTKGNPVKEIAHYLGEMTNNAAEYTALLIALEEAKALGAEDIVIKSDSELMVRQLTGQYKVKSQVLMPLYLQAISTLQSFNAFTLLHVPRAENKRADELANQGVKKKDSPDTDVSTEPAEVPQTVSPAEPAVEPIRDTPKMRTEVCRSPDGAELTLVMGDCLQGMRSLVESASVDVVVTSPPYNLGINYSEYDDSANRDDYLAQMDIWASEIKRVLAPKGSFFLNVGSKPTDPYVSFELLGVMRKHFALQNTIYWVKSIAILKSEVGDYPGVVSDVVVGHYKPINSKRFLNDCAEFIFHFSHSGDVEIDRKAVGVPYQDKTNIKRWGSGESDLHCRGNTWFIPYETIVNRKKNRPHPASFPVELPRRCITLHGKERVGQVLDPFMGIGSTGIACAQLGISFIGFEIAQDYFQTAHERIEAACTSTGSLGI